VGDRAVDRANVGLSLLRALAVAALSASAAAQNPQAPINTLTGLEAALLACWVPPPMEQSRLGMQIGLHPVWMTLA